MTDPDRLREHALAHIGNRIGTHYDGCESDHWQCCMKALLDRLSAAEPRVWLHPDWLKVRYYSPSEMIVSSYPIAGWIPLYATPESRELLKQAAASVFSPR